MATEELGVGKKRWNLIFFVKIRDEVERPYQMKDTNEKPSFTIKKKNQREQGYNTTLGVVKKNHSKLTKIKIALLNCQWSFPVESKEEKNERKKKSDCSLCLGII